VKRIAFVTVAAALLLMPATSAWARGDGWELVELPNNGHVVEHCGSTVVDVTWPLNQEYQRTTTLVDGTVVTLISGRILMNVAARSGPSLTLNVSGPAKVIEYPNGDVEVMNMGLAGGPPPIEGLPELIWTAGSADIVYHPDGSMTVLQFPHHVVDVCAALRGI
jgi:hypothetical protein